MTRTAVSPSKRLGSSGTAFAFSSSYSREESSLVSTSSMWWLSCRLQPSKPPGKTWPSRTIKGLRAFHGLFFLGGGLGGGFPSREEFKHSPSVLHTVQLCVWVCHEALFPDSGGLNSSKPVL